MVKGFWEKLETPFFTVAPMYDVTDAAFRRVIARYSAPDVLFTEFVSADGLAHPDGREKLMPHLWFDKSDTPTVAQIFGVTPRHFEMTATLCRELGFAGVDINMGCPEKNIVKQGTGAALIRQPALAHDLICAARAGAGKMPVSVKTRIGFDREEIDRWIPQLLEHNLAALTVHLRTRKEMSAVDAHWDVMERIVVMRDAIAPETILIGNGDVTSIAQGRAYVQEYGCDGIMIGRGLFGNPWFFADAPREISPAEKLRVMCEHTHIFADLFTGIKNFAIMKKHYKAYVRGFPQARTLREKLMAANSSDDVQSIVDDFLRNM